MTTYITRLESLDACSAALWWCREHHPTSFRAAWGACLDGRWMIWLLVRLDRRRGVGVLVEVVRAMFAHLAADEITTDVLNPLAAWAAGDDTIDLAAVRKRERDLWLSAYTTAYAAAAAAAAAAATANAADAAYAAVDATADWSATQAAMIRDLVPYDEVERMLMA